MAEVLKTSTFAVDVERSIAGLREAADALAAAGAPADAQITASVVGDWLHIDAEYLYLPDDDEDAEEPASPPMTGVRA
jgi:hypothetical protein